MQYNKKLQKIRKFNSVGLTLFKDSSAGLVIFKDSTVVVLSLFFYLL